MVKAIVESIGGDMARVLIGDEAVAVGIPVSHLPREAREGTPLRVKFIIDPTAAMPGKARGRA